jgi:hypothetical protein
MCGFHQNEKRIQNSFENCFGNLEKKMKGFLSLSPFPLAFWPGRPICPHLLSPTPQAQLSVTRGLR